MPEIIMKRHYDPDEGAQDKLVRGLLARLTPAQQEESPDASTSGPVAPRTKQRSKAPLRVNNISDGADGQELENY